ncbi:phospholipase D-like domain-containing protein [Streptomyces sp. NBC_00094]|uniref:phospholipase D-like domain-containing protein n=1 Tax=Streptomyces sp. NBC_00094 TaxID=2903620 RepID=UPI0022537957|nr:phospholipase D-like domain-containing protein [Streptomyces sp. NBC_00094]MCX5388751.1 FG-GAP-like repeat-containing protein [Streptomyces sp. NBC_00094]
MRIRTLAALALSVITAAAVSMPGASSAAVSAPPLTGAPEAQAAAAVSPPLEAVFNNPLPTGTAGYDRAIEKRLLELIGTATPASSIRVSLYTMEDRQIADALINAQANGTDVRVLSERCPWVKGVTDRCAAPLHPEVSHLAQGLGNAPDGTPRVVLCKQGCMQNKDINHDKFWLFSALNDGRTNVAVQSSHNLAANTAGFADNMVISSNDVQIYQGYEHTWNTMRANELANKSNGLWTEVDAQGAGDFSGHAGTVAGWRYPRNAVVNGVMNDPVARSISALDCSTGPEVHIAMSSWGGRAEVDKALAAKVDDPGAGGKRCKFRIVTAGSPELAEKLEPDAAHPNRDVQMWAVTTNSLNGASGGVHSKYVLLSWDDADGTAHRVVHTGSDNFNDAAVQLADETGLRITDSGIYNAFKSNWEQLRRQNDLTANKLTDIPFLYNYANKTTMPLTFGTTEFGTFRDPKRSPAAGSPTVPRKAVKGDVNGDGVLDIVNLNDEGINATTGKMTFSLETFLGKPDGRYSTGTKSWTANSDWGWYSSMRLTSGDYNGDGRDDVAALYTYAGTGDAWKFLTFLANPDGTFSGPRTAFESKGGWALTSRMQFVSGKFDSDLRDDISVLSSADGLGLHTFTAKADGTFNAPAGSWHVTNTGAGYWGSADRTTIVSGNFDGQGGDDIAALYDYADGAVGLHTFTSQADGGFNSPVGSWKELNTPNLWGSADRMKLTTGDFDGDGRDDVASLYGFTTPVPPATNPPMAVHIFGTRADGKFNAPFRGWYNNEDALVWASIQLPAS